MRYLFLALLSCLFVSGCTMESGYNYRAGYYVAQPVPVYYSGSVYTHPHHYYHGQVVVTPHSYYRGGVRGKRR
jgi:hypothetical protein